MAAGASFATGQVHGDAGGGVMRQGNVLESGTIFEVKIKKK